MASVEFPPSSLILQSIITEPRLKSRAWSALAIKLLQTKPPSLSISEYIALLRSNTASGDRSLNSTSERQHIEACEFWRKRFEVEAARAAELQARVHELTKDLNTLKETNKVGRQAQKSSKVVDQLQSEEPAKKKARTTAKGSDVGKDMKRTINPARGQKNLQVQQFSGVAEKEDVFDEACSQFSGSTSIYDLILSLRLLHFTKELQLIPKAITRSSQALQKVIQDFINGGFSSPTPDPTTYPTRGEATAQAKELQEITKFSQVIERSCEKIFSALSTLVVNLQEAEEKDGRMVNNDEFIADGICAVIANMTKILSLIQGNSRALLSAALFSPLQSSIGKHLTKDIRLELTMLVIRQLTNLGSEIAYRRNILEGIFYNLLEIIGGILLYSFAGSDKGAEKEELLVKLAVEETSWYLLRILEAILPIVTSSWKAIDGRLGDKSREKLKSVLIKGLFDDNKTEGKQGIVEVGERERRKNIMGFWGRLEGPGFSDNIAIVDSPFSRVLWELLGLDMLAGLP